MSMNRFRQAALSAAFVLALGAGGAQAQSNAPIRIGILTDLTSAFAGSTGLGSVAAANLAVEEFGPTLLGRPIEVVSADHGNKADVGAEVARRWFDTNGVEVIADLSNSAVALSVQEVARTKKKILMHTSGGVLDLSGKACSPYGFQWTWDSYGQAKVVASAVPRQAPDSWFLIAADYAFGNSIQREVTRFVTQSGGTVVGTIKHPFGSTDLSSFLLQAQGSGARTIVLSSGGGDLINLIKQTAEFGINKSGVQLAATNLFLTDVHALGLETAQGLLIADNFYWDRDDASRAWSRKFFEKHKAMPTVFQAGTYSGVLSWLKAVKAAGTLDADAVAKKMHELPVDDVFARGGTVRGDGRLVKDMLLLKVKSPAESKGPWDYMTIMKVVPGAETVVPKAESECPAFRG